MAAVIVIGSGGGSGLQQPQSLTARGAASATGTASTTASATTASGSAASTTASATTASATPAPTPLPNGRKIIQSAQLALEAPANRIDFVAQEVFRVMGRENGVVGSSNVTSGTGGYAQFQLSVPSSTLGATMSALSELSDASVISRTDATQDVNGQYLADSRKLADDRALRTSLLRQLAKATSQQQIDALKTQIRDAEASIRSDESTLRGLTHSIDFSQITVTINAAPAAPQHHSGAFTLSRAWHDAGRVLTIAAGVALITLAALVPLALLAAIGWWISTAVRRRRREQALDVV